MKRLHVIGRKNHGKTTLVEELIGQLRVMGYRVGSIKHTHHHHELDTPGKDSHRHRIAGSAAVGILSPAMSAVFVPTEGCTNADRYSLFAPMFHDCDLVLVEGDVMTTAAKIEVWRSAVGPEPMAAADSSILAVVSDDAPNVATTVLQRRDVAEIATWICRHLDLPQPNFSALATESVGIRDGEQRQG